MSIKYCTSFGGSVSPVSFPSLMYDLGMSPVLHRENTKAWYMYIFPCHTYKECPFLQHLDNLAYPLVTDLCTTLKRQQRPNNYGNYISKTTYMYQVQISVHKITAGHRSISDHSMEMTAQIVVWLVLLSDHILVCASTSCKLGCNSGPGSYGPESSTLNAITSYIASPSPKIMSEQN